MPSKAPTPCAFPRCPETTHGRYCEAHTKDVQRRQDQRRGTAAQRGYSGKVWQWLRKQALMRDHWMCQHCGRGVTCKGEAQVDHIVPKEQGGADELDNLQTLCRSCHSRKTAREDGGFGNAR